LLYRSAVTASGNRRIVLSSLLVGIGLLAVIGFDYAATRRELLGLLTAQAASLRQIVAAAARSNVEAGKLAESQLSSRLLENARYLAELDRRGALSDALLDEIVARHTLFRVSVFDKNGQLERSTGPEGAGPPAAGEGRQGRPEGAPAGRGRGGEDVALTPRARDAVEDPASAGAAAEARSFSASSRAARRRPRPTSMPRVAAAAHVWPPVCAERRAAPSS